MKFPSNSKKLFHVDLDAITLVAVNYEIKENHLFGSSKFTFMPPQTPHHFCGEIVVKNNL